MTNAFRRRLGAYLLFFSLSPAVHGLQESSVAPGYSGDFDAFWSFVAEEYAYFDTSQVDWDAVGSRFSEEARVATNDGAFLRVLESALRELHDDHAHLGSNTSDSPRMVPSGTDVWAEWQAGKAVITDVRRGSGAQRVGLRPGARVLSVAGQPIERAVAERMPKHLSGPDLRARDWALRSVLAGRHGIPVRLRVDAEGRERDLEFTPGVELPEGLLSYEARGDLGYIRVHDSLGDTGLIPAFDAALAGLRASSGLVLDLRDTPSGGNTTVARGILGRFVAEACGYQRHELVAEERRHGVRRLWVEHVAPRGPFRYAAPLVVLVGRWTGSMGEGLAIGLQGTAMARVVGRPMAGLLGAIEGRRLPRTGLVVRIPTEKLFHADGTPREDFVPELPGIPAPGGTEFDGSDRSLEACLELLRGTQR